MGDNGKAPADDQIYDVAILGAGMAGGMLGAVLARNGVKVLLMDAGTHPRFAVGESTIPYTSSMTKIIAERYGVPEIAPLATFRGVNEKVSPMSGRKSNFGFVYHVQGRPQRPEQINQLVIPEWQRTECHLFRQDSDAYLFNLAVDCGADPCLDTRITGIDIDPDTGVVLRSAQGAQFRAKYLVDGAGYRSPTADAFNLRDEPPRARHHSRSLFTHMVGVTPFDDASAAQAHKNPSPWHHGTLHHVFDGGWLWVIPFDNHEGALSTLCSVGLTLDERVHPKPEGSAQEEFDDFLRRFPQIAEQFTGARAVRPWISTGRLQYSASNTVGERYTLTSHAAGFIDALYSRGLTNTLEVVNSLAWRLIAASRDGDWSTKRFAYIDKLQQGLYDVHDDLVYSSFVGFRHYELWNAVSRVWKTTSILPTMRIENALRDYKACGDEQVLLELERTETPGLPEPVGKDLSALLAYTRTTCQAVEAGELEPAAAAERIFTYLRQTPFVPAPLELGEPDNRFFEATPELLERLGQWGRNRSPQHMRSLFA
ncbi:NAD(P)/FAD-dependent oxidoreductase [Actinacidiphila paucisporea]|uniref:FADH2 O2-dependent halogenase n=1 Tax=Actinacidiphila paucisporea TaxID=310782 RepID=A0A1M7QYR0_9ACTN|nr:tryptophan 7-halogenase [Actinacidiphila paucisporea]SHN37185.1 FADH2 O2-dependent halogenase [Actinacidiphila paucisporea]